MDKNLQPRTQNYAYVGPQSPADATHKPLACVGSSERYRSLAATPEPRFPPTRAARASRGRGVFFGKGSGEDRSRWIEVPVALLALAVSAFALVVCLNAASMVGGPSLGANPGPAIVAAASVPPAFIEPVKLR